MRTRRQRAWDMLQQRREGWGLRELAEALEVDEGTLFEDLRHLQRSARRSGLGLEMLPARCAACGWLGRGEEPRAPSRCPACKGERLLDPRFRAAPR